MKIEKKNTLWDRGGTLPSYSITFKVMDNLRPDNVMVKGVALI